MSWALQTQFDLALQSLPGQVVMQLPETKRPVRRSDILAVPWGLGRMDAIGTASAQAQEERN